MLHPILYAAFAAAGAWAQSTTSAPDISNDNLQGLLFLDTTTGGSVLPVTGFAASLVCGNPSGTTFVLGCAQTGSPNSLCAQDPAVEISLTSRSTDYMLQYRTGVQGVFGTVTQSCVYPESTIATCSLEGYLYRGARTVTLTSTISTISSAQLPPSATIQITAGADHAGGCLATSSNGMAGGGDGGEAAASTVVATPGSASANAAIKPGLYEQVYKVLVPVGLGALVAL